MPNIICGCGKTVETKPEWAGQWIACPGCGGTLYAPFPGDRVGPPIPVIEIAPSAAPAPAPSPTRPCPWCAETIPAAIAVCPICKGDANARPAARPAVLAPPAPAGPPSDTGGVAALVVGILGFMFCQVLAPVAWAMGSSYEKDCRARGVLPSGAGTAGRILGIVGTVFLFLILGFFVLGTVLSGSRP
ncbi:MAG TPA: DUF4190 domain-containing protein [Planctomycetota bacterium]|nr:DUF4190 domain-containing protein [Planctomycetota bacterium]